MTWQPIETAPLDGTEILAYYDQSKTYHVMSRENDVWIDDADQLVLTWPTHWMPLPEPPK